MKRPGQILALLFVLGVAAVVTAGPLDWSTAPRDVLKRAMSPGKHVVSIMAPAQSSRLTELIRKMKTGISKHPEWWMQHLKAAANAKESVPYHPNIGMTEVEYRELNDLNARPWTAAASAQLSVTEPENGVLLFAGIPQLDGIQIDLNRSVLETQYGTCSTAIPVSHKDDKALGNWTGLRWECVTVPDEELFKIPGPGLEGVAVVMEMGQREQDGRGILKYQAKRFRQGSLVQRDDLMLTYDVQ